MVRERRLQAEKAGSRLVFWACLFRSYTIYGFEDYSEDFSSDPLAFYYMAGVEVDKDTILPEGVYRKVVQKAKYAVFTVNGNNANGEIWKALRYIYFR